MEVKLPIYSALINEDGTGVFCVSLVTNPATEVDFVYFDKDKEIEKFAVENPKEHIVAGVIMLADTLIYRRDEGYEYYITYSKDTLKQIAEQMIKDGVGSNVNIQHVEGSNVEGVNLQELFVIDREKGIDPVFFKDVPDGSLIGFYKVHNQEVWEKIENGDVLSFSLEGIFNLVPEEFKNEEDEEYNEIVELINKLKNKLK